MGAPIILLFLTNWSHKMSSEPAWAFALGLSLFSMTIIVGVAFMGAYRFLKTVGLFKGHYYY
jgi:hypothetical protein